MAGFVVGPVIAIVVAFAAALVIPADVPLDQPRSYYVYAGVAGTLLGPGLAVAASRAGIGRSAAAAALGVLVGPVVGFAVGLALSLGVMLVAPPPAFDQPPEFYLTVGVPAGVLLGPVLAVIGLRAWSRLHPRSM